MDKKEKILDELKGLQGIPSADFEKRLRQILGKKCWWSNIPAMEKDGDTYRYVDFRCCGDSAAEENIYCLNLDRRDGSVSVTDGFVTAI